MFEEFVNEKLTPMVDKLVSDKVIPLDGRIDDIVHGVEIITDVIAEIPKQLQDEVSKLDGKLSKLKLKNGKDGRDGKDGVDGKDGSDGLDGLDGVDGSPDTPTQVKDKLESLKGESRLDKSAIKGLDKVIGQEDLDRAVSILDSRTSFLINKINNLGNTGGGGGGSGPFSNITGTPNRFALFDNLGNGATDNLATRDFLTGESYIGYRTGAGQFTNALQLGNFLGSFITDGVGFQRHDSVNDNYTVSMAIDATAIGGTANTVLSAYFDPTNGITSTHIIEEIGNYLDYGNDVVGAYGNIGVDDTNAFIQHNDDGNSYSAQIQLESTRIQSRYEDIGTGRVLKSIVDATTVRGGDFGSTGGNNMRYVLDDANKFFEVSGLNSTGDMLKLDANTGLMGMGDVSNTNSHVGIYADDANSIAYVDGLKTEVVNWNPTLLSDGFTGTGLNDMHYDSTVLYTGPYPNTYTATIVSVGSVYVNIVSIITPGFVTGDTVTDGSGSTGTIIGGSEVDGFFIIAPIVDAGWLSVTTLSDISTGASATVSGAQYVDTFSWSSTDGGSGIIIPCFSYILLNNTISVGFDNISGHTLGDSWEWEMIAGYTYSKMALFDGANRTMSIGDVEQTANDVRTDWVLGTGNSHGIYHHLADAQEYYISNSVGNILVLDSDTFNQTVIFSIEDPFNGQTPFSVEAGDGAYGFGFHLFDAGPHLAVLGAEGTGNNTFLKMDDDTETITLNAAHISSPLAAYDDDTDAGSNGVIAGELYQTTGSGASPLNVAGIVMIKQ